MKKYYSLEEFKIVYKNEINEIIIKTLRFVYTNNYSLLEKDKLLKDLIEYIYYNSDHYILND